MTEQKITRLQMAEATGYIIRADGSQIISSMATPADLINHIGIKHKEEAENIQSNLISNIITEVEALKKKTGTRTNYICPKCNDFGGKDTYCMYDRRKLVEKTEHWETDKDENYNNCLKDVLTILKKHK